MTLLHYLKRTGKRYGVVSLCMGTGMGAAAVYENPYYSSPVSGEPEGEGRIPGYKEGFEYFSKSKL